MLKCYPKMTPFSSEDFVWWFYCYGLRTLFLCFCLDFAETSLLQQPDWSCELVWGLQLPDLGARHKLAHQWSQHTAVLEVPWGLEVVAKGFRDRSAGKLTNGSVLGPLLKFSCFYFIFVYTCFLKNTTWSLYISMRAIWSWAWNCPAVTQSPLCLSSHTHSHVLIIYTLLDFLFSLGLT